MHRKPEEAAPTFATWQHRLEAKDEELQKEVDRFVRLLKVLGTPMVDEKAAHFIYYNQEARHVAVAGDFQQGGWMGTPMTPLGRTGVFYRTIPVSDQQRIEYKFVVDGNWVIDPLCPNRVDNGVGGENSVLMLGEFREPPELLWNAKITHGDVNSFQFRSRILGNTRSVYVYLPAAYSESPRKRFPTLYVHDGGEYLNRARLAIVLDNLIDEEEVPPLVAVMVDPVEREPEYRANENFALFMEKELLPHIQSNYRVEADRESRGVMGASMGGLISMYLGLSRPRIFSKIAGQSSALFFEEDNLKRLANSLKEKLVVYLDVGRYETEFLPAHRHLIPLLEAKGCTCFFQEVPGGHNWTTWRAHLKDLLTFLWGKAAEDESAGPIQVGELEVDD